MICVCLKGDCLLLDKIFYTYQILLDDVPVYIIELPVIIGFECTL